MLKDLAGTATGKAFVLFARSQPDTPGKLATHGFSYEHMELAAYELLGPVAEQAGDAETVQVAERIGEQERAMASGWRLRSTRRSMRRCASSIPTTSTSRSTSTWPTRTRSRASRSSCSRRAPSWPARAGWPRPTRTISSRPSGISNWWPSGSAPAAPRPRS